MRKLLMGSVVLTIFATATLFLQMTSCKKTQAQTNCPTPTYQIAGLWIGTYTVASISQPPLYFSLTVYPDGTLSYKSKGSNGYIFYANGTWTLTGSLFSYTVVTTNNPGTQQTQTGTATYSDIGALTNGLHKDTAPGGLTSTWSMTRVN